MQPLPSIFQQLPGCPTGALLKCACALLAAAGSLYAEVPQKRHAEEDGALPLPRWTEQEIRAFRESLPAASGALLPEAEEMADGINDLLTTPLPFGPRLDQGGLSSPANAEILPRLRAEDMRLFLPESLLGQSSAGLQDTRILPTPLSSIRDVTPEFLASGKNALPQEYLIDPGMAVTEVNQQELTRFLEFHAHEALIKLHVLILPGDRKLPTDTNLDEMCSGSLAKGSACLLVYPIGEPWRARLFLSKSVHDHASPEFMKETARACVGEALHSSDVHDQLRNYAVELSTRLFWLQKALGTTLDHRSAASQPLAEISSEVSKAAPQEWPAASLTPGILVGLVALGGLGKPLIRRFKRWNHVRQRSRVWLLPEVETVPRLGGAFTGGGGGMICYGKPVS